MHTLISDADHSEVVRRVVLCSGQRGVARWRDSLAAKPHIVAHACIRDVKRHMLRIFMVDDKL